MRLATVLLSGGFGSATTAMVVRRDGFAVHALSFRYGQRYSVELLAVAKLANLAKHVSAGIHRVITDPIGCVA